MAVVADINNLLPVQKQKAKIVQYHEMCGKECIFFKSEVKIFIYQPEVERETGLGRMTTINIKIVIQLIFQWW